MGGNKPTKKTESPITLSYIDEEKGFQIDIQSLDDVFEHISPEFTLLRTYNLKGSNHAIELYANKEALEYKH